MASNNERVCFDALASDFAFRVGQLVETLLLEGGLDLARGSNSSVVTQENIQACINESLISQLRSRLHERPESESRKVA